MVIAFVRQRGKRLLVTESNPPLIELDEHDAAAVTAILIRAARAGDRVKEDNELIEAAKARVAANNIILNKAIAALALFGIEKRGEENVWNQVARAIGDDAYLKAIAIARGIEPGGLLDQMGDARSVEEGAKEDFGSASEPRPVAIRDAVLRHLRSVGDEGTNVAQIKRHLAEAYGITVHEKTPGMTLYRLMKAGLARRVGRTWFATENEDLNGEDEIAGADQG